MIIIKSLSQFLISVKIIRSSLQSLLIIFMSYVSYELNMSIWYHVNKIIFMLSDLLYIMCLFTLHSVLFVDNVDQINDFSIILIKKIKRYLHDEIISVFIKLYLLCMYDKMIVKNFYQHLNMIWFKNQQIFIYKENFLKMMNLIIMMQKLLADAENLICEQLMFQNHNYLQTRHFNKLTNNWTWHKVDDNLIDITQSDHLQQRDSYLFLHLAFENDQNY